MSKNNERPYVSGSEELTPYDATIGGYVVAATLRSMALAEGEPSGADGSDGDGSGGTSSSDNNKPGEKSGGSEKDPIDPGDLQSMAGWDGHFFPSPSST